MNIELDLYKLFNVKEFDEFKLKIVYPSYVDYDLCRVKNNKLERYSKLCDNWVNKDLDINHFKKYKVTINMMKKANDTHCFNEKELNILKLIDKKYKYISRDNSGSLGIFEHKPIKNYECKYWSLSKLVGSSFSELSAFDYLFKDIKWTDEEPVLIDNYVDRD